HLYSAAFFRCHPADHRPSGSGHSCPCHGDHSLLTRGGNRADDIGSGKLGTRSALEFALLAKTPAREDFRSSEFRCFGTGDLAAMFSPSWQAPSFLSQKSPFKIIRDFESPAVATHPLRR